MPAKLAPRQNHLRRRHGLSLRGGQALGDGFDFGSVDQKGDVEQVVPEGGVRGDEDVLGGGVLDELGLREAGVALDLVDGGDDAGVFDDGFELGGSVFRPRLIISIVEGNLRARL